MSISRWLIRRGLVHETPDEYRDRIREYMDRPEVIERMRALPATHTYSRSTGELKPIKELTP